MNVGGEFAGCGAATELGELILAVIFPPPNIYCKWKPTALLPSPNRAGGNVHFPAKAPGGLEGLRKISCFGDRLFDYFILHVTLCFCTASLLINGGKNAQKKRFGSKVSEMAYSHSEAKRIARSHARLSLKNGCPVSFSV